MAKSGWIVDVTIENFQKEVLERSAQVPVVIDVWASWCAPCKQLLPILEKLTEEYAGRFILAKVNADEQQALVARLGVRSLPTVFLLHGGRLLDHFGGALPESGIRQWLDKYVEAAPADPREVAASLQLDGRLEDALAVLQAEYVKSPGDADLAIQLACLELKLGHLDAVARLVAGLPEDKKRLPQARQLQASLDYAAKAPDLPELDELVSRHEETPDDPRLLLQLGQKKLLLGLAEEGMAHLYDLQNSYPAEPLWRRSLLEAFEFLGMDHVLTRQYRRKLYASLH